MWARRKVPDISGREILMVSVYQYPQISWESDIISGFKRLGNFGLSSIAVHS